MEMISATYAEFVTGTRFESLNPETVQHGKKAILDLIGVSLAGYQAMAFPKMVVDYFVEIGGKEEATVIQANKKIPAPHAAFVNASCAHALDMDDGHRFAASHPGVVVIPAALAAAELAAAGTKALITGIVVGYEIMIRIGRAIVPSSLDRGFHITGITGTFGAAAAAANIMGLSWEETIAALGMAGLQSAGLIQVNHEVEGSMVKSLNPARASSSGLLSCILARKGAKGPEQIFEGEDGFLKAFSDDAKRDVLTQDLGLGYEISKVYLKLYSACRHAHAAIDAALEAFGKGEGKIEDVDRIVVETYPAAVRLAGIPHATTPSAGRFSIPFSVALALVKGDVGADKYCEEMIRDGTIQELANRVALVSSEKWEAFYPQKRGATVTIVKRSGGSVSAEVDLAKGEPENPAGWEEIEAKFFANATQLLSRDTARKLAERIANLEKMTIEEMTEFL
ncbi:MAG: MmgE/PrpD family protein [Deltaproteobacteria bacterium]|nr:MmgE/PrpD family protein [Deltaproteobacteria bacterium]